MPELGDLLAPLGEDFIALVGIGTDRQRAADMVQHDLGFREGAREIDEIPELGVEHPRFEGEIERRQCRKALAPGTVDVEAFAGAGGEDPEARILVPGRAVPDAAETSAGQDDVLLQNALGAAADAEIDIADNAGAGARRAVFAALAHRRDAGDELRLAERAQFGRALGAVHLAAFEKDRGADIVAAVQVFEEIMEEIAVVWTVPQVMVRVDDRPVGLERGLLRRGEPVLADRQMAGRGGGGLHRRGLPICRGAKSATPARRMPRF